MRDEPALNRSDLAAALRRSYGCTVTDLTFVPSGWISACYQVTCAAPIPDAGTDRAFLKLQPTGGPAGTAASSPAFYLPLTRRLHDTGLLPHIAYPLATGDGHLWTMWRGWRVILHNAIAGELVGFTGITDAVLSQLAGLLGRLHRALPALDLPVRFRDRFAIPFAADLLAALPAAAALGAGATAGQQALRAVLLPRRDELRSHLRRLQAMQARVRALDPPPVICHTDLHGENLMRDAAGRLYIIDWENAVLAPREHDLWDFSHQPRFDAVFRPPYEAETGPLTLNPDLVAFYTLRRRLEDITADILLLLAGTRGAAQDAVHLRILTETLDDAEARNAA